MRATCFSLLPHAAAAMPILRYADDLRQIIFAATPLRHFTRGFALINHSAFMRCRYACRRFSPLRAIDTIRYATMLLTPPRR